MSENSKKRSLDKLFGKKEVRSAPPSNSSKKAQPKAKQPQSAEQPAAQPSKAPTQSDDVGPGGYLGESRYRRGGGVMEKPSIYVRPDQALALRMAAATKDDPNGKTMSEIIQSLLDQNGYSAG